ncbi:MAG TPA: hypothetical protein PKH77_02650 [Anaerolineae bacterium]|nr:hypothetical protein [Anaerolineae bacterium]
MPSFIHKFAIWVFLVSGLATIIGWGLAYTTNSSQWVVKSKRWLVWTIIFSALAGFSMCSALAGEDLFVEFLWPSIGVAFLTAISIPIKTWVHNCWERQLDRDFDLIISAQRMRRRQRALQKPPSRKPGKTVIALVIGLLSGIGWVFWQKRKDPHKSKKHTES